MSPKVEAPKAGELQVVALLDEDTFVGLVPLSDVDETMDTFERRLDLPVSARTSLERQAALRSEVARRLRDKADEDDWLASACVWLAVRHHSGAAGLREGIATLGGEGGVVLTCSIGPTDASWTFMVGDKVHDVRRALAVRQSDDVDFDVPEADPA